MGTLTKMKTLLTVTSLMSFTTRPEGQYVAINGSPTMWLRTLTVGHKKNQHLMMMAKNVSDLDHLSSLADQEKIKPVLAKTLPFTSEALIEGFELLKSRRAVGKI